MAVTEALTRPIGPLAAWQWGAVAVGGFIAYKFISGRGSSSSTTGGTAVSDPNATGGITQGPQGEQGPAGNTISGSGVTPSDITDWLNAGVAPGDIGTIINDLNPVSTNPGVPVTPIVPSLPINPPNTQPGNTTPGNIPDTTIGGTPTSARPAGATGFVDTTALQRIWSSVTGVKGIVPSSQRSFTMQEWVGPIVSKSYIPINTGGPSSKVRKTGQFRQILSGPHAGSWVQVGSAGTTFH